MTISENDVDAIVMTLLEECMELTPPLTETEIVTLFKERIILEAEPLVVSSLFRLVERNKVEMRRNTYRLCEKPAA